ncbi:MAG: hypothetical protein ACPG6P_13530 [Akkermansiaceae bacterium]
MVKLLVLMMLSRLRATRYLLLSPALLSPCLRVPILSLIALR